MAKPKRKVHQPRGTRIQRVKGFEEPGRPAAGAVEKDYLVIFEESDEGLPSDDHLVLDIEAPQARRGEMDVQQKLDIGLTNTTSRLGTAGFAVTLVGALASIVLMAIFALRYPDGWYDARGAVNVVMVRTTILVSVIALLVMIVGTILTHYGRRIKAKGELRDVRIVEKEVQSKPAFE